MDTPMIDRSNTDDEYQIEFQHEAGFPDMLKFYLHNKKLGITIVRICKMKAGDITIPEDVVPFINLS